MEYLWKWGLKIKKFEFMNMQWDSLPSLCIIIFSEQPHKTPAHTPDTGGDKVRECEMQTGFRFAAPGLGDPGRDWRAISRCRDEASGGHRPEPELAAFVAWTSRWLYTSLFSFPIPFDFRFETLDMDNGFYTWILEFWLGLWTWQYLNYI